MTTDHTGLPEPMLKRTEASRYLKERWGLVIAPMTLAIYAAREKGPPYHIRNRWSLYPVAALDRWAESQLSPLIDPSRTPRGPKPQEATA